MTEPDKIDFIKRDIEIQLEEYKTALKDFAQWMREWKARQPQGFRAVKRRA